MIIDNLGSHEVAGIQEAIEQTFAKLKTVLRKAATRSVNALRDAIGKLRERFTPAECGR